MKLLIAGLIVGPAVAAAEVRPMRYLCERGVEVPVVYIPDAVPSAAVIEVEGRMIALEQEMSGSGVRYGWPSDGSHYVWWSKGMTEAMLLWSDGETGEEVTLLAECVAQ